MIHSERLKGIDAFVATADAGSFTAAAERLNLTNSAVSKSVARLEERLGTRLFERTTRRLALTEAGTAFYRTCVRVLADLEEAETVLAAQRHEPAGRLRLDVPAAFGRLKVLPLLLAFAERYPGVRPHVSFTDRFVDLLDEGIDVAIRIGGPDHWPASLGHRHLGRERLVFCASPAYLARHGTPASPAELVRHDAVLYGKADGTTSPWRIAHGEDRVESLALEGRIVVGSGEAQVAAVKAGYGIAQLATWLVDDEIAGGALVPVLPSLHTDGLPLNLVWPLGRQLLPKVDAVLEQLAGALRIS
ncbi:MULTISPECIES: LysR family transcriptional regulator [Burkholderia]|uniref:LysR family transcriptional regulator n=1 Tax=Burkholderia aenigmatica TaxID=2015348 RepID=A0A6J5JPN1_9BURK|nr:MULTISPECIES: LysR family transcriptional regulator [Burkholderia]CAB3973308.1 LysR family transcriptional regulator [Burkholderia aenigmatica]VWD17514.1 LysR family transcriptional regulator [Burkholderia aenigmatica]VWD19743.1 LysR family transcriptional regulator [Burkholderia aenigmatica]